MKYSEEFKQKVLSLKNINIEYAKFILNSPLPADNSVGALLVQYSKEGVPAQDVIVACEKKDFQSIYEQAKEKLAAKELYEEWMRDYYPQFSREFNGNNENKKPSRWRR